MSAIADTLAIYVFWYPLIMSLIWIAGAFIFYRRREYKGEIDLNHIDWPMVMAATILTITPILIVFLLLQRRMIKGLTSGAVKG